MNIHEAHRIASEYTIKGLRQAIREIDAEQSDLMRVMMVERRRELTETLDTIREHYHGVKEDAA